MQWQSPHQITCWTTDSSILGMRASSGSDAGETRALQQWCLRTIALETPKKDLSHPFTKVAMTIWRHSPWAVQLLNIRTISLCIDLPLNPSCMHATVASLISHKVSHTVCCCSTLPLCLGLGWIHSPLDGYLQLCNHYFEPLHKSKS